MTGKCRECGCTEHNACTARTSAGKTIACSWIEPDLCSACTPGAERIWTQPARRSLGSLAMLMAQAPGAR